MNHVKNNNQFLVSNAPSEKVALIQSRARLDGEEEAEESEEKIQSGMDPLMARMLKTRSILLSGVVDKNLAERVVRSLLVLEATSNDDIRIFIDSPGGDVDAGYAIFDMIRFVACPVWTIGMGLVASAGALILLAAPAERRVGLPNSHYLIHQPLSGMRGVATDIEIHAKEIEKTRERINKMIADETGKSIDQVSKDTDRDYWLSAEEAKKYGLISRVVAKRTDL